MEIVLDIETDSLNPTIIHCIAYKVVGETKVNLLSDTYRSADRPLSSLLDILPSVTRIIGHNLARFDIPVIKRLVGPISDTIEIFDTLPIVHMIAPNILERSFHLDMPDKLKSKHSLAAWGYRLKLHKGEYTDGWDNVSDAMVEYCKQDVLVTERLYKWIESKKYPQTAITTELELAPIINKMEENGFYFDTLKAEQLYAKLLIDNRVHKLNLLGLFPTRYKKIEELVPKRNLLGKGIVAGVPYTKVERDEYNPGSRQQFVERMKEKYNWVPNKLTEKGNPIVDEDVLEELDFPEAQALNKYFMIQKRIGQLATGDHAWLKYATTLGRVHGKYSQCGTISGRASHFSPNIGQVPSTTKEYGQECRELFCAPKGKVLVGVDLKSLEPRCFAGYMAKYDKGAAIELLLDTSTDMYQVAGDSVGESRKIGKTLVLAMLYGAGDKKLGRTVDAQLSEYKAKQYGKEIRSNINDSIEGFEELNKTTKLELKTNGYIIGLDGRRLYPNKDYSCLNTLLQSAGAVIAKRWLILCDMMLHRANISSLIVAFVHDELVFECQPEEAQRTMEISIEAAALAGEFYNFPCPMSADGKIGRTWADVH